MIKYFLLTSLFFSVACASSEIFQINLIIKDHKFQPEEIEVPAGTPLRLTIENKDATIEEFDSPDLKREKIIPGNSSVHIKLAPLRIGRYYFVGEFHADTARGYLNVK